MRDFLATPFVLIASFCDWITTLITGHTIIKLAMDPETAEEFLSHFEDQ